MSGLYIAKITDIPIGKFVSDQSIDVGFQATNQDGSPVKTVALFDRNTRTSQKFDSLKQLRLVLGREEGKVPYPCSEIYLMNGKDRSQPNRIKRLQIEIKANGQRTKWVYVLLDTLQYQRLDFPKSVWFGKNSEIRIEPLELYSRSAYGEITELAIEFE